MNKPTPTKPLTLAERRAAKIAALQAKQEHDLALATARDLHADIRPLLKDTKAAIAATRALLQHLEQQEAKP